MLNYALISAGVITSGVIITKAVTDVRAGRKEQQRRARRSQREDSQIAEKHQESVSNNIGKPSPDGTPDPKRPFGQKPIGQTIVGGVVGKMAYDKITNDGSNKETNKTNDSNSQTQTTTVQGDDSSAINSQENRQDLINDVKSNPDNYTDKQKEGLRNQNKVINDAIKRIYEDK